MDLWQAIRTVARRWYVLLPVLLVLLGATYAVVSSIRPTYEATAIMTLLPPTQPVAAAEDDVIQSRNPYLTPNDGYQGLTKLLVAASLGNDVGVRLHEEFGFDESMAFEVARQDGSAILTITVEGPSARRALEGAVAVRTVIDSVLEDQQIAAGVPESWLVSSQTVSDALVAAEMSGSRVRVAIGLGAASILIAVASAYFVDGWVASRAARSEGARGRSGASPDAGQDHSPFDREGDGHRSTDAEPDGSLSGRRTKD